MRFGQFVIPLMDN